jgi:hypothetical protein
MTDRVDVRNQEEKRLPPGQIVTVKWPVLHYGTVPKVDLATWRFRVWGAVEQPFEITWDELMALPRQETVCDIHCVTRWSRYDNVFGGIPVQSIVQRAKVKPEARFVLVHAEQGYTTNVPLSDLDRPANLLALTHNGSDLDLEHGGPARLLIPHLYLWKSANGDRVRVPRGRLPRILGAERLSQARRAVGRGAIRPTRSGANAARPQIVTGHCLRAPWGDSGESYGRKHRPAESGVAGGPAGERYSEGCSRLGREAPLSRCIAPRAVCIRLGEMVADQRHYLAPLPEPQETERRTVLSLVAKRLSSSAVTSGVEKELAGLTELELKATGSWALVPSAQSEWITTAIQFRIVCGRPACLRAA